jgi:hypothetical protein
MNTQLLSKNQFRIYSVVSLFIIATITAYISVKFSLGIMATIGAASGLILCFALILIALREVIERPIRKWNDAVFNAQQKARSLGFQPFNFGPKNQHVVWQKNKSKAGHLYTSKILPLAKKNPHKDYYFITREFNNL